MKSIRIRNLRALKDTGVIKIKPLNVLLGKNSSGKSTFLRSFPLFKQSLLVRTQEPILWYAPNSVDFGSFAESINITAEEKIIEIEFSFEIKEIIGSPLMETRIKIDKDSIKEIEIILLKNSIKIKRNKQFDTSENVLWEDGNHKFSLYINNKIQGEVTGYNNWEIGELFIDKSSFFISKKKEGKKRIQTISEYFSNLYFNNYLEKNNIMHIENNEKIYRNLNVDWGHFLTPLLAIISQGEDNKTFLDENSRRTSRGYYSRLDLFMRNLTEQNIESPVEFTSQITIDYKNDKNLRNLIVGACTSEILMLSSKYINKYYSNVHYIAPLRATAERYYRVQGLAVDEIDPMGENIPMVLAQLSNEQKRELSKWTQENFGFQIQSRGAKGHTSLYITFDENNTSINLADTGFGYSQILPIIMLLWKIENHKYRKERLRRIEESYQVVIEQPELHLHPALQSKLIDVILKSIRLSRENNFNLNITIETHSEIMINRIGIQIANQLVSNNDVNILMFDKEESAPTTAIKSIEFDSEGILNEWPIGFFYPED